MSFFQWKGLSNRLQDIKWLCLHSRMPVRDVLQRHGLSRLHSCPREVCGLDETIDQVFWGCGFAKGVWDELVIIFFFFFFKLLSYHVLMLGLGLRRRGRKGFLLWLLLSIGKAALWDARAVLVKGNVDWGVGGVVVNG